MARFSVDERNDRARSEAEAVSTLGAREVDLDQASGEDWPFGALQAYRVWRLDDNGGNFKMGLYATRSAADRVAQRYEDRGHKQSYWVEPETWTPRVV